MHKKISRKNGFQLNLDKWNEQKRGKSQYVTGLTVFDAQYPRIPKKLKKRLRQIIYYASKYGLEAHLERAQCDEYEINKIDGLIAFIYSIEPQLAYKLDSKWQEIIKNQYSIPKRKPKVILDRLNKSKK